MLVRLLKLPKSAFRYRHVYGIPVTRNPVAWIPFFLALPFVLVGLVLFYLLVYPVLLVWMLIGLHGFSRKTATFSETGITFTKAYGRRTVRWSEIREVVRHREPTAICYRLVCESGGG